MGGKLSNGERIKRKEAKRIIDELGGVKQFFDKIQVAGSYRRVERDVGDIEFVGICNDKDGLREWLEETSGNLWGGGERMSAVYKGVQIDFQLTDENSYGAALLFFTGSKELNVLMRVEAKKQGKILNQRGVFSVGSDGRVGERLAGKTEEEIFEELSIQYLEPRYRGRNAKLMMIEEDDPNKHYYKVQGSRSVYTVMVWDDGTVENGTCTCPHYMYRLSRSGEWCKHIDYIIKNVHEIGKKTDRVFSLGGEMEG